MNNSQIDGFIREGISKYLEATETIAAFRQEVGHQFGQLLNQKKWRCFDAERTFKPTAGSGDGHWVGASLYGTTAGELAQLELALWWAAPGSASDVIAYCGFYKGPGSHTRPNILERDRLKKYEYHKRIYAMIAFAPDDDLEAVGKILVDAVDDAVAGARNE